jgi:hypothetical protein
VRRLEIDDADLAFIWRAEIRVLQRLAGYPGGREYLTSLLDAGQDDDGFYLVLDTGARLPLLVHSSQPDAASSLKKVSKQLLWENLRRLALGLQILHTNGLIHRNLDAVAVFSALSEPADFQLGGFEWTIVLRKVASDARNKSKSAVQHYSFQRDWRDLGVLIAQLLDVDPQTTQGGPENDIDDGRQELLADERQLLRELDSAASSAVLNGDAIIKIIDRIIRECGAKTSTQNEPLYLLFDGSKDFLWRSVLGSGTPDHRSLVEMLQGDLETGVLLELDAPKPRSKELALCGRRFTYYLKKYGAEDWTGPTLDRIEAAAPHSRRVLRRQALPDEALEVVESFPFGHRMSARARGRPWDSLFEEVRDDLYSSGARLRYDAFVVLHLIELLEHAAQTWRIVIRESKQEADGEYRYIVAYVEVSNRRRLSDALGLNPPLPRLLEMLEKEGAADAWQVVPVQGPAGETETDDWTFIAWDDRRVETLIQFRGSRYFPRGDALYLSLAEDEGQEKLMRRRGQLLSALKDHAELTDLLSSPLNFVRESYEPQPTVVGDLDRSKRDALAQMSNVLPMYLLQGPPGVGKTFLVNELVRGRLAAEPTSRVLITAQGHDALNHLMRDVCGELAPHKGDNSPLIVRSKSRQERDAPAGFRMRDQAAKLVAGAIGSTAFKDAPEELREQLQDLRRRVNDAEEHRVTDRALESLLLRSANLVFSTTNSADLKSMIDSSVQFDWSIVEEAGRATGTELLAPLMLSHRRLLIGDPKQLPPFGEEKVKALLKEPERLKRAFECGRAFLQRSYYGIDIDDLIERYTSVENIKRVAGEVEKTLLLFAYLHRDTFQHGTALPMAGRLDEQYRMHPIIADLVSSTFYEGELRTADKTRDGRKAADCPYEIVASLPFLKAPIVVVDVPWIHKSAGRRFRERTPAYHNPSEVQAVVEFLAALRCSPGAKEKPSLAVLTPYNEQVKQISRGVAMEKNGRLAHLADFDFQDELVHTIDSFQGGEADIVVVSLVRNNARPWRKGLGILADARRMNVLLSRAKWKLVIVGSLEFLRRRFPPLLPVVEGDPLHFLRKLNRALSTSRYGSRRRARDGFAIVPYEKLVGPGRQ